MREQWTGNKIIRAKFDGAIAPEEWHTLQKVLNRGKENPLKQRRRKLNPDFPLRRFLRCPSCGKPASGAPSKSETGKMYLYYDCQTPECKFRMGAEEIHTQFLSYLQKVAPKPNLLALFKAIVVDVWDEKYNELNRESIEAAKMALKLKEEKRDLIQLMKSSKDSPALLAELQRDFAKVDNELTQATSDRDAKETEEYNAEIVVSYCSYYLEHASELWGMSAVEDQNRLQELIFPEGIHADSLEAKRTPIFSLVYEAIKDIELAGNDVAAPGRVELPLAD